MPYITKAVRDSLARGESPHTTGELNYAITRLLIEYVKGRGMSYQTLAEAKAACTDARDEFQRRVVAPYEDRAAARNGDVYEGRSNWA